MFRLPNALESLSNHNGGQLTKVTELLHSDASLLVGGTPSPYLPIILAFFQPCLLSSSNCEECYKLFFTDHLKIDVKKFCICSDGTSPLPSDNRLSVVFSFSFHFLSFGVMVNFNFENVLRLQVIVRDLIGGEAGKCNFELLLEHGVVQHTCASFAVVLNVCYFCSVL